MPHRSVRCRSAARILVVAGGQILLQGDTDHGVPGSAWWVTPGGGIDPGETAAEAAIRELWEETGLIVEARQLRGPVAFRRVRHAYSDRVLIQHETFFRVDVAHFAPKPQSLTAGERTRMTGHSWFRFEELPDVVWPANLSDLLAWSGGTPLDLRDMDESTL